MHQRGDSQRSNAPWRSLLIAGLLVLAAPTVVEAQLRDLSVRCIEIDSDGTLGGEAPRICSGTTSPEGNLVGKPGDLFFETDAAAGGILWIKDGGTGDDSSGWVLLGVTTIPVAGVFNTITLNVANPDARISRIRNGGFLFSEIGGAAENFEIDLGFLPDVIKFESFSGASANYLWTASTVANLEIRAGDGFVGTFEMGREDNVIIDTEVIGVAQWVAKGEGSGGDANLPGAAMWAEARGAYDATNNPTALHWCTSESEDCGPTGDNAPDMTLDQDGDLGLGGQIDPSQTLEVQGNLAVSNAAEGGVAEIVHFTTRDLVTLTGATTDTTTISIPSGAIPQGCSFNVDVAVVNSGDNTWSAAFITGSTATLATLEAAALDTKVDTLIVDEVTTGVAEVQFTPQSGTFSAGQIEVVCYYRALTSLGNV